MAQETLKWKLFPFSLVGGAKHWYTSVSGNVGGDWVRLRDSFCLTFFPFPRVIAHRKEIIMFQQLEETLGAAWARFSSLIRFGPDLRLPDEVLLQHFYVGLDKDSIEYLNIASEGSFIHKTATQCMEILNRILGYECYTGDQVDPHVEGAKMTTESEQSPSTLQDSVVVPEPPIPQNSKEEEI